MHTQINSCGLEVSGLMSISDMQPNACNTSNINTLKLSQMTRVKDKGDSRGRPATADATTESNSGVAEVEAEGASRMMVYNSQL